ncbi:MAG: holo-ACP synthase [Acidimicrobiales bacterium]
MVARGVGVDVVDVARFALALSRRPRIVERLFTEGEQRDGRGRAERLAARFAAKEAVMKSLGVGLGSVPWRSIEVVKETSGQPRIVLHGAAKELAARRGVAEILVSLTHSELSAIAMCVAEPD